MKLSVILPCFNAEKTLAVQLEALAQQEYSKAWEVVIADNGSCDRTLAIAHEYLAKLPNLQIVDASYKPGAAHARNIGALVARGEYLAFCDADDEVAPGWVAAMGEALSKYDLVGGRDEHWKLNEPWIVQVFGCEEGSGIYNHPYLPMLSGNNLGVKRFLHEAIGGFDETLLQLEDVDYCWRLQQAGAKPYEVTDAVVHFRLRTSTMSICDRAWKMGCQEAVLYKKHRPIGMPQLISWKTLLKTGVMLPLRLLLQVRNKVTLVQCLMELAWRGGQLRGCIKYGYLPF
ncbi:glycosyltransferase family 2 protein [Chlorogloeopsis fritschii PCC 9212]|uniref:Glycosyl transferase n=1 Tax=Chlorogloeopsis fritschii PCC 6912 TaxID=211165 RepID=A0A433N036_CHLFR|nr:glycosyltransferase [Chlorogloeopsis fritschii]RUR74190.1 glycosyl transferase [Chlorogloeopsis fritschii PCC 6912]